MKKKEEAKYLDKEWLLMTAHLKAFFETEDQEALHKFRVEIKKLRAMLYLFEIAVDERVLLKQFKPVRKIFKQAGIIRDAHMNLQLGKQYQLQNEQFEASRRQVIEAGIIELRTDADNHFQTLKDSHKKILKLLTKITDKDIAAYYKMQLEQIAGYMAALQFNEDLHTARKLMKILIYNYKLAGDALAGTINLNIAYLDKLQETIGKWHDNVIAAELFALPEFNDKTLINRIKRVNAGVKRNIATLANNFLGKAIYAENNS